MSMHVDTLSAYQRWSRERTYDVSQVWARLRLSATALAVGFVFILAGANIAAFILGLPVIGLIVALVGDTLLFLTWLHLRKTGQSVDDPISAPAARRF